MKVALRDDTKPGQFHNSDIGPRPVAVTRSLPFFVSSRGSMTHRVRSAQLHIRTHSYDYAHWPATVPLDEWHTHVSMQMWCGQGGFLYRKSKGGFLFVDPPDNRPLCGTCEGRAVGAGEPSAAFLVQRRDRVVLFTPREVHAEGGTQPMRGWWNMPCWNGLSAEQQRRLIEHGNLPIGYEPEGECERGASVAVETASDTAPGPRFYCTLCAMQELGSTITDRLHYEYPTQEATPC